MQLNSIRPEQVMIFLDLRRWSLVYGYLDTLCPDLSPERTHARAATSRNSEKSTNLSHGSSGSSALWTRKLQSGVFSAGPGHLDPLGECLNEMPLVFRTVRPMGLAVVRHIPDSATWDQSVRLAQDIDMSDLIVQGRVLDLIRQITILVTCINPGPEPDS